MGPVYGSLLWTHSLLRWVVLIAGVVAVARAVRGWGGRRRWTSADDLSGLLYTIALDVELLVGFVLYAGVSPFTAQAFSDFGGAMGDALLRFWAVEHPVGMLLGISVAHIARGRVRRAAGDAGRFKLAAILFGLSLVIILVSIPWPWMEVGRPFIR
jgi:hypothetical protein